MGLKVALREVFATSWRKVAFVVIALVVAFLYAILLPFNFTQRFELANLDYLDISLIVWSVLLGLAMSFVLVVQIYATRSIVEAKVASGTASGLTLVVSLLPSFLCCTPIVPTFLAFVGVSGVDLYTATGSIQHFFAVHQTEFLAGSLLLLLLMAWWGLSKVAKASCLCEEGCEIREQEVGVLEESSFNEGEASNLVLVDLAENKAGSVPERATEPEEVISATEH